MQSIKVHIHFVHQGLKVLRCALSSAEQKESMKLQYNSKFRYALYIRNT